MSLFARSKRSGCSIDMINNQITLSKINKYFKKNKVSISEIQKYLKKKGFTISKKKDVKEESNLGSLTRTFLSSLIIIAIFSVAPLVSDLTKKNQIFSKDFENNSKNNLKALIENKEVKIDEDLNNKFLFDDVLQFDEQPVDTVRLSASTIEELFKSTDYNLNDVRKNKLVKPI
jgi:Bax protein